MKRDNENELINHSLNGDRKALKDKKPLPIITINAISP